MKLTRFKVRSLVKERPFLAHLIKVRITGYGPCVSLAEAGDDRWPHHQDGATKEVRFERASLELLNTVPSMKTWDGSAGDFRRERRVHAVLKDGKIVMDFVSPDEEHGSNWAHSPTTRKVGESIASAIDRTGIACEIEFLVAEDRHRNTFDTAPIRDDRSLTVYKLPKGSTIAEIISEIEAQEAEEVAFRTSISE